MTHQSLRDDYLPTINKIFSKKEVNNWCLSNCYKEETKSDIELLISNNPDGFPEIDLDTADIKHIKDIERIFGGRAEYMNPVSVKHKLYKFMPTEHIHTKRNGYVLNSHFGKWFFIQSVGNGAFAIRTDFISYKLK